MNDFFLPFDFSPSIDIKITHNSKLIFLGSCFSDEISKLSTLNGFQNCSNPFGTIFHPIALANVIMNTIDEPIVYDSYINSEGNHFSLLASSKIFADSKSLLFNEINNISKSFYASIRSSDILFVTFGTAWGYMDKKNKIITANCHKMPKELFSKELSSIDSMFQTWTNVIKKLTDLNPNLKIVFTVSPVRHLKDGLVENNRSKSRLIELVNKLKDTYDVVYFPSYEIVIDQLRDYRFYKVDRVHPNREAINFVWSKFMNYFMSSKTVELSKKIKNVKESLNHVAFNPQSNAYKKHLNTTLLKKKEISELYPSINWK